VIGPGGPENASLLGKLSYQGPRLRDRRKALAVSDAGKKVVASTYSSSGPAVKTRLISNEVSRW